MKNQKDEEYWKLENIRGMDVSRDVIPCVMFKNAEAAKSLWGLIGQEEIN